jgi:hypothetical protein
MEQILSHILYQLWLSDGGGRGIALKHRIVFEEDR